MPDYDITIEIDDVSPADAQQLLEKIADCVEEVVMSAEMNMAGIRIRNLKERGKRAKSNI